MKKKVLIMMVVVAAALVVLTGCGRGVSEIPRPTPSEGAQLFEAEGTCEAKLEGNILTVSGTANLMDGTNGVISVHNADGTTAAEFKFTKEGDAITHDFPVEGDWQDTVCGFITFDTQQGDKQPKEVTEAYGKKFENLTGADIIWNLEGVSFVLQSEYVTIR